MTYYSQEHLSNYFGKNRIENRYLDIKSALADYTEAYNLKLNAPIDEIALSLCFESFNLFLNFTKPFIDADKFANNYKIASNLIFTILPAQIFIVEENDAALKSRKRNVDFALHLASMILQLNETSNKNWFTRSLHTNATIVNSDFDTLQEHFLYYLTHIDLSTQLQPPIVLQSLFLHSFTLWWQYDGNVKAFGGLQL